YDPQARKVRYQSTRMTFIAKRLREIDNPEETTVHNYLSSQLTPEQDIQVRMMLRNSEKKKQGWRFTPEDNHIALASYKQSPKVYKYNRSLYGGPGKTSIYKHAAKVRFQAGINPKLMHFIKASVEKLQAEEKYVTVAW